VQRLAHQDNTAAMQTKLEKQGGFFVRDKNAYVVHYQFFIKKQPF
jgi:hypothetical protein